MENNKEHDYSPKKALYRIGATIGAVVLLTYVSGGVFFGAWNGKELKDFYKKGVNSHMEHVRNVNSGFNELFKDAKTFQDSVEIFQKYDLPIILPEPTFQDKERVVGKIEKENQLEKEAK